MIKSAFVLAAGRGERLRPLTDKTPKPLLPVQGKPMLDHILGNLLPLKLERVVLNAWHLKEQIVEYAKSRASMFSFEIVVSEENELLGTGGGLKQAWPMLKGAPFLMVNGDCLWKGDIEGFVKRALARKAAATWWLTDEQKDQTSISVSRNEIIHIGKLWSANGTEERRGCYTGIQVVRELMPDKLPDIGCITRNYWIERLKEGRILGADFEGLQSWTDIGTLERYQAVLERE